MAINICLYWPGIAGRAPVATKRLIVCQDDFAAAAAAPNSQGARKLGQLLVSIAANRYSIARGAE